MVGRNQNLPMDETLDHSSFIDEVCGKEPPQIEEAMRWMTLQKTFDVKVFSNEFVRKYLNTVRPEEYLVTAKFCHNLMKDFELSIDRKIALFIDYIHSSPHQVQLFPKLLKTLDLVNGLYERGISPANFVNCIMYMLLHASWNTSQRIEALKVLQERNVIQRLKSDEVDQRFLVYIDMVRAMIKYEIYGGSMTINDINVTLHALVESNFIASDGLPYKKMEKVNSIVARWCNDSCNLKRTLQAFTALELRLK